ncbi:signal recognition particle-docking protein FtsY [Providencia sp. JGM181]|uniref:signal recognition particle-docking protein FtsY n=1 Tax=unclassified Providencia TaxID=2633465 RepID=UPI001BABC70C|nr:MULTISPECIES: signal recognition particle-docking protein FtsY [unclassified Providencia]MBS0924063.1 signal recognition particle-docking protein FtsY [Providencia sp. JGM181]MBS0934297.1 signal recognition particle-docking protein FtsY [Providencia sp. JGM172]MBS0998020.1 signal recognition particle-docking protein FtsY [Providencia sp. JGM178]
MAKDKKKGFFSWLGFGRKNEEETQQPDVELKNDVVHDTEQQDAATAEAERQHQAELDAIKAAEDEAERQYQAEQDAITAAAEEAERQHKAQLEAMRIAAENAEQERQVAEEKRIAEEKAAREALEAQALRQAEEAAERQHQIEQAAIKAAEEEVERQHQAELAVIKAAEEKAEREYQAAEAARLAQEQADRERQEAEITRLAEEEAERQRQAELAAIKEAEEKAERERQEAEAARLAEEEAERQRQAELAAIKEAEEKAERERQETEAARLAEEEAARIAEEEAEAARLAEEEAAKAQPVEQEKPKKEGFFSRLKKGLLKTRQNLGSGFLGLFKGKKIDDDLFEELEEQLLIADVGVETTRKIIDNLTQHASRKELKDAEALYGKLREEMSDILATVDKPLEIEGKKPYVILMVGVNGVGKTTTIGKLARQYQSEGKSVMLAAGDTFRAAAVEQLQVWGDRNNISVVAQHTGADPASVIFDAIQSAQAKGVDVLIADTAGRLQNKAHLMEELKKIVRVMKKLDESAPHEIMLTLDASTGQNAVSQAKIFNDAVGLTGITLTKLDGTAKGGVIFSIADQFGIPIRYIGIGEGIEDLRPFKADDFIEALFAREE